MHSSRSSVCVYCGSRSGAQPAYKEAARALGRGLANHGIGLIYGGGAAGLMGALADAALAANGEVIGVIPRALFKRDLAHNGLSELIVVDDMPQRKAQMAARAQAIIGLPGVLGATRPTRQTDLPTQCRWLFRCAYFLFTTSGYCSFPPTGTPGATARFH